MTVVSLGGNLFHSFLRCAVRGNRTRVYTIYYYILIEFGGAEGKLLPRRKGSTRGAMQIITVIIFGTANTNIREMRYREREGDSAAVNCQFLLTDSTWKYRLVAFRS